ncbi:hypothetical protein D5H75_30700 [Bailinhaonella thermotolerans]|uniref:Uncharacterized protein n=2 Tax=Bailinhaonella thermotolerans TaxID=1070861 RepID=A0A3A4A855_9ACTN|nr:hypothetical protein [Bailinhaonella thermotolerans]RJL24211.1 hypothetical protein D5H75_30700 [Bailinhaonella thermotolerans]
MPGNDPSLPQPHGLYHSGVLQPGHPLGIWDATLINPSMGPGTGDAISTNADLIIFLRALLGGRLLPPALLTQMRTLHPVWQETDEDLAYHYTPEQTGGEPEVEYAVRGVTGQYGLGITKRTFTCPNGSPVAVWGHNGAIPGSLSYAYVTEDGSRALAFNVNGDWPARVHKYDPNAFQPSELIMFYDVMRAEFCTPA